MSSLYNIFDKEEISIIIDALEKRQTFYATQAKNPIKGHGKATEYEKKRRWADKAYEIEQLIKKISINCD